jgi:hypothetical protein
MASYPVQRESESAQAYQAACAYFSMGADRSLDAVAQKYNKSISLMGRWSAQHDWTSRAREYDTQLAEEAAQAHTARYLADLEQHRIRSTEAARGLYTVAGKLLQRLNKQVDTLEITPATLGVLLKAFQTSLDIEAHALGIDQMEETQG